jgi:hypothetical protein
LQRLQKLLWPVLIRYSKYLPGRNEVKSWKPLQESRNPERDRSRDLINVKQKWSPLHLCVWQQQIKKINFIFHHLNPQLKTVSVTGTISSRPVLPSQFPHIRPSNRTVNGQGPYSHRATQYRNAVINHQSIVHALDHMTNEILHYRDIKGGMGCVRYTGSMW